VSWYEKFAPEFSTIAIAEYVVDVTKRTSASSESSYSSKFDVTMDQKLQKKKKSAVASFAPEISTMKMECIFADEDKDREY